jgi:hypothetical protein
MIGVIRKNATADDFEVKLANVADAEITQRLPSLNEYKVGFQLIERNDEGTRGMGVMVYKMGDQWIYVPAFFLNGRIRGYDLMYLPEKSQFVPAKDTWVSYVRQNRTPLLGNKSGDLAKSKPKRADAVSLRRDQKSNSIMFKSASLIDKENLEADLDEMTTVFNDHDINRFDLRKWIPRLGKEAQVKFMCTLNTNPDFANAILNFYDPEDIRKIAAPMKDETPAFDGSEVQDGTYPLMVNAVHNENDLQIITSQNTDAIEKLDDKAKEVVLRDGLYVVDNRKNTSTVFVDKQAVGSLTTPPKSGYYEVLLADGSFRKCYVIVTPKKKASWKLGRGINNVDENNNQGPDTNSIDLKTFTYLVIDLNKPKVAHCYDQFMLTRTLEAREATDLSGIGIKPTSLMTKFRDKAKKADSPEIEAIDSESDLNWNECVAIDSHGNYERFCIEGSKVVGNKVAGARLPCDTGDEWRDMQGTVELTGKPGHVCRKGSHLYIPDGARIVSVRTWGGSDMPLGDIETIKHRIIKTAGWRALTILTDGISVSLDGMFGKNRGLTKQAAMIKLVKEHGIGAADARELISKQASVGRPHRETYLVKYAAPAWPDSYDEEPSIGYDESVPTVESETLDPQDASMSEDATTKVIDASEKGVKDVMDVSVLKSLAASGSPNRMVDDYLQDLMLAMDRIGRILFMFYWHYNSFKDQYGHEKMSELEDSLRDNFQNLSDLTLFLHNTSGSEDQNLFADDLTENFA